ncbi:hypothetical protein ACOBQJ_12140 [Pelotomaculum propionicicum]|uniref:hypothetical protein n=1 Tax=Pelotomaculum propionicicum TaxID=258475 RepID=UPI003B81AA94
MRLIARFEDKQPVGFLIDTLRNGGFDRKDMVVSSLNDADEQDPQDPVELAGDIAFIKTEREGLWESGPFAEGVKGLTPGKRGIIVAVETPKHEADRVRSMMKESGALEIIQD